MGSVDIDRGFHIRIYRRTEFASVEDAGAFTRLTATFAIKEDAAG